MVSNKDFIKFHIGLDALKISGKTGSAILSQKFNTCEHFQVMILFTSMVLYYYCKGAINNIYYLIVNHSYLL